MAGVIPVACIQPALPLRDKHPSALLLGTAVEAGAPPFSSARRTPHPGRLVRFYWEWLLHPGQDSAPGVCHDLRPGKRTCRAAATTPGKPAAEVNGLAACRLMRAGCGKIWRQIAVNAAAGLHY